MMYSRMVGTRRTRSAAKRANCVRAVAVKGVVLLPMGMTVATIRMSRKLPGAATDCSASSLSGGTALWPGDQIAVIRIVSNPAALASSILAVATAGSALRPSSSAAPMYMLELALAPADRTEAARTQAMRLRDRRYGIGKKGPWKDRPRGQCRNGP